MANKHKRNKSNLPRAISHPTAETTQKAQPTSLSASKPGLRFISAKELLATYPSDDDRLASAYQAATTPKQPIMAKSTSLAKVEEIPDLFIQPMSQRLSAQSNCSLPIIGGILPEGVTLLAGKAGSGLSHFALDLAISVASGQALLGSLPSRQGSVIFVSEHDRVQTLLQSYGQNSHLPSNLSVLELSSLFDEEGTTNPKELFCRLEEKINDWRDSHEDARLIIIDSLDAICNNRLAQLNTYAIARRLSIMSFEMSVLVLHQVRRTRTPDAVEAFSRLSIYTDYVQSFLLLHQHSSQYGFKKASLRVVDPSLAEQIIPICFDPREGHWQLSHPEADAPPLSPERDAILRALHDAARPLSPTDLATILNQNNGVVRTLLHSMSADGQVFSPKRGLYIPLHPHPTPSPIENVSPPNNIGVQKDQATKIASPPHNIAHVSDDDDSEVTSMGNLSPDEIEQSRLVMNSVGADRAPFGGVSRYPEIVTN